MPGRGWRGREGTGEAGKGLEGPGRGWRGREGAGEAGKGLERLGKVAAPSEKYHGINNQINSPNYSNDVQST